MRDSDTKVNYDPQGVKVKGEGYVECRCGRIMWCTIPRTCYECGHALLYFDVGRFLDYHTYVNADVQLRHLSEMDSDTLVQTIVYINNQYGWAGADLEMTLDLIMTELSKRV